MIEKAQAIALHSIRYGESSMVAYLYTKEFGRIALMVNGAYGKSSKQKKAIFFQPLSLLNLVFYPGKNHSMGRLKELSPAFLLKTVHFKPVKRAIALFIGEVIYKTVREEESNPALFNFLENSIQTLDFIDDGASNFHLIFLSQLSKYLGFFPHGEYSTNTPYFDYKTGVFCKSQPQHPMFFNEKYTQILSRCLQTNLTRSNSLSLSGDVRREFLNNLLAYFAYHMDTIHEIRSISVLSDVFDS